MKSWKQQEIRFYFYANSESHSFCQEDNEFTASSHIFLSVYFTFFNKRNELQRQNPI